MRRPCVEWVAAVAIALLVGGTASNAHEHTPKDPGHKLLQLMSSGDRVTYEGTQAIEMRLPKRRAASTARVAQYRCATRTEILSPPHLQGMVILDRDGRRLVRRRGSDRWHAGVGSTPLKPRRILRNHTVTTQGQAVIAGRPATIGEIRSRASGRLVRRIWMDREKGVVLRAEHYNWAGKLVFSTEFQQIDYNARLNEDDFEVEDQAVSGPKVTPIPVPEEELRKPGYMAAGFQLVGRPSGVRTMRGVAVHLRYSDGLNAISVFVRKLQPNEDPKKPAPMPGMGGPFSAVVHHVKGDYRVTIIGDASPAELHRIAESIE